MLMLQILGALFVVLLAVAGFFAWRFYRGAKNLVSGGQDLYTLISVLPPLHIDLEQGNAQDWTAPQRDDDEQSLLQAGFEHTGYFKTNIAEAMVLISLWNNPKRGIAAALMEAQSYSDDDQAPAFSSYAADVFVGFSDGGSLTVTSNKDLGILPRPPQHLTVSAPEKDIKHLFSLLKPNLPAGKKIRVAKDIKALYIKLFEEGSAWVWQADQLRSTSCQDLMNTLGVKLDDQLLQQLLDHARMALNERISERVLLRLAQAKSLSAASWEQVRERLVVVHSNMHAEDLSECLYALLPDIDEAAEAELEDFASKGQLDQPLEVFAATLTRLKGAQEVKRFAKIKAPVPALIYISE